MSFRGIVSRSSGFQGVLRDFSNAPGRFKGFFPVYASASLKRFKMGVDALENVSGEFHVSSGCF